MSVKRIGDAELAFRAVTEYKIVYVIRYKNTIALVIVKWYRAFAVICEGELTKLFMAWNLTWLKMFNRCYKYNVHQHILQVALTWERRLWWIYHTSYAISNKALNMRCKQKAAQKARHKIYMQSRAHRRLSAMYNVVQYDGVTMRRWVNHNAMCAVRIKMTVKDMFSRWSSVDVNDACILGYVFRLYLGQCAKTAVVIGRAVDSEYWNDLRMCTCGVSFHIQSGQAAGDMYVWEEYAPENDVK